MECASIKTAACAGMADIFYDPRRVVEAIAVCDQCGDQSDCLRHAIDQMFVDEHGKPIAWLVHAGLLPSTQERLWDEACGDGGTAVVIARQRHLIGV